MSDGRSQWGFGNHSLKGKVGQCFVGFSGDEKTHRSSRVSSACVEERGADTCCVAPDSRIRFNCSSLHGAGGSLPGSLADTASCPKRGELLSLVGPGGSFFSSQCGCTSPHGARAG